ncbi:MAG: hypothetical protein ACLPVW_04015 [Terriglobales bacterium]
MGTASAGTVRDRRRWWRWLWLLLLGAPVGDTPARAQTCQSAADMDTSVQTALETTAKRYFEMSARGDTAALQQNSIASVAASFAGIEAAVKDNQAAFSGANAKVRPPFLLTADGPEPLARAEFLCGVFGKSGQTRDSAVFILPNLPPGKYGVTILEVNGGQNPKTLTLVLQQVGAEWKLAGFYAKSSEACGHDAAWFTQRARDFKSKGQNHNAWLYYREAIALSAPVDFMSTLSTDRLYDETQAMQPSDVPVNGNTIEMNAGDKIYHSIWTWIDIFPLAVGDDLDVVVKYQIDDVSNTARAFQENTAMIKALVVKFPELREAFAGVVARAVEPSGRDYGTLIAMKEIK